jgi:hypothetical protein
MYLNVCIPIHIKNIYCLLIRFPETECLDIIQTKVLRVFLLVIRSHLHSFPYFFKLTQPITVSTVRKPEKKPFPLSNHTETPTKLYVHEIVFNIRYLYLDIRGGIFTCKAHFLN